MGWGLFLLVIGLILARIRLAESDGLKAGCHR